MKRIDTATRAVDLFGAGKDGYKDGNKAIGIAPTELNASVFNALQEEISNVIESTGVTLNPADNTQLSTAIKALITNGGNDYIARFTTTANINLTGLGTQAGGDWAGALTAGDTILVKDNTTGSQNGWYVASAGAWDRATWADASAEIKPGALTQVSGGATLADSIWMLTTDAPIVLGATSLAFVRKDAALNTVGIQGAFKKLKVSAIGINNANVVVTAEEICLENLTNQYFTARNVNVTINSAGTVGAINSSSSALAVSTWYSVWLWWNGSALVGTIDTSFTSPIAPSGYVSAYKARVGSVKTDASGSKFLLQTLQLGKSAQYVLLAGSNTPEFPTMASGAAGTNTATVFSFVSVSISAFVPPTSEKIKLQINTYNGLSTISVGANNVPANGWGGAVQPAINNANSPGNLFSIGGEFLLESTSIYWASSTATGALKNTGWEDSL